MPEVSDLTHTGKHKAGIAFLLSESEPKAKLKV